MHARSEGQRRAELYAERQRALLARAEALEPRIRRSAAASALALLAAAIALLGVLIGDAPPAALLACGAGLAGFAAAFARRARLEREADDASRRAHVNAAAAARCRHDFTALREGGPAPREDGARFIDARHPPGTDLDLFGPSSLYQLVSAAHTDHGQRALARLFTEDASPAQSRERQRAVRRLAPELELRQTLEALTLPSAPPREPRAALSLRSSIRATPAPRPDIGAVLRWIQTPPRVAGRRALLWAARLLPAYTLLAIAAHLALGTPSLLWTLGIAAQGLLAFRTRRHVGELHAIVGHWQGAFARLAQALRAMRDLPRDVPLLQQLRAAVDGPHGSAPLALARLDRVLGWFAVRDSEWAHPLLNLLTSWDFHCAVALEHWQRHDGPQLQAWLEALGQLEALSSLAGAAHDHAEFTFPDCVDDTPCFIATDLAHPLIPASVRVHNDLALPAAGHALLVTGSNMSGKSTLLRAIGLATVLARAGGPVCARHLRLGPLSVHTSLRVADSLADNVSRFYAELQRLRAMLTAARGPLPVLFLIDEILAGTNSLERGIGARWLLAELLRAGALGALSTHDAHLCQLPPELAPRVQHVHFRETFADGQLSFDYRLHPGPVKAGNALRLMRAMGLAMS